jgi:benzoylformate decarboxylase
MTSSLPSAPPIFMYHEFADGDYLPAGAELWAVTSDPDEAARAPVGHILIGDPAEAVKRLADTIPAAGRPALAREPLPQADTTGPAFTDEAIMDAVNAAKTDSTVFAHEWTSTMVSVWDRLEITRPWTAAQHNVPAVFVVARNSEYRALKEFSRFMHDPDAPGMELPGMDIPVVAAAYGVQSETVKSLSDLTHAVRDGLSSDRPLLIEISQHRIGDA